MADDDLDAYFDGKPDSYAVFRVVEAEITRLGYRTRTVGKQISYGNALKFAWFWLYNVTARNPSGVLHLMLALDEAVDSPHVRNVNPIGRHRWNHQIVLRTTEDAAGAWLIGLLAKAHAYSL